MRSLGQYAEKIEHLAQAVRTVKAEDVRSQPHALKGAAASIAAKLLSKAASQLVCAGKESNAPVFATLFQGIQTEFDRLAAFISKDDWMEMAKKSNAHEHVRQSC